MNDKVELEARRSLKKNNIIDCCRKAFSAGGIEATSISKLCKSAKVNPKVMYDYFASKEEIVLACAARSIDMIADMIVKNVIDTDGDIISNIDNVISECYSVREEVRFLYQVVVSPNYRQKIKKFITPLHEKYEMCKQKICLKYNQSMEQVDSLFHILVGATDYYCLLEDEEYIAKIKKVVYPMIETLLAK